MSLLSEIRLRRESRWGDGPADIDFEDGEIPVKQEKAISTSSNIEQVRSISSEAVGVYTTTTTVTKRGAIQHKDVLLKQGGNQYCGGEHVL